ncbi:MAG: nitronate monooxygenase, partial [Actinomycetota bacterium]
HAERHVNAGVDLIIAQGYEAGGHTGEAETHPVVKEKMLAATSDDTVRSRSLTGKHARMLKSAWTEEWDRPDTPDPLGMPLQPILTGIAQMRIGRGAATAGSGAEKLANYFVGQIVGTMNQRKTSRQVVFDMIEEFIDAVEGLSRQLEG